MKKSLLFTVAAIAALSCCFTSCDPEVTEELEPIPQATPTTADDSSSTDDKVGGGTDSTSGTEEPAGTEKPAETGKTDENDDEDPVVDNKRYMGVLWNGPEHWDFEATSFTEKLINFSYSEDQGNHNICVYDKTYNNIGIQLVDAADFAKTEITNPIAASSVFSLSDDGVYLWDNTSKSILKATLSDSGYDVTTVLENVDTIVNSNISSGDQSGFTFSELSGITYFEGWIYFAVNFYDRWDYQRKIFLCAINLNDIDNSFVYYCLGTSYHSWSNAMSVYKDSEGNVSLIFINKNKVIQIGQVSLDVNNKTLSLTEEKTIYLDSISDLIVIDDICYAILRESEVSYFDLIYYNENTDWKSMASDGSAYNSREDRYITKNTGGLVKINLKTGNIENWSSENWCLGRYKSNDTICTPPLSEADKYFYGPRKIIAIKPDVLYIADDGYYLDLGKDENKLVPRTQKNMNRIVTVNLKTESISAEDAKVGFSGSIDTASEWDIFLD